MAPTKNEGLVIRDRIYTVSEVTEIVKTALEVAFPQVWVEGEVSGYKKAASGHVFFNLKDEKSVVKAVMWQSTARKIAFDLKDGLQVVCRGKVSVYEPRGDYQLYVDQVEPKGKGALQLRFEQLKEKLRAEGLFDETRKRKLPLRPRTIGVVTSPTGAAIRDILRVLERRYARLHVVIYPARVQGEGAAAEIVEGIDALGARPGMDVLIVGRGGGSIEDLWAFNEEPVARAIARSPVPVISAVGHEVDFTIADFVADLRAPTPSAAAEMVIATEEAFVDRIDAATRRLGDLLRYGIRDLRGEVDGLARNRIFQNFPGQARQPGPARGRPRDAGPQRPAVRAPGHRRAEGRRPARRRTARERPRPDGRRTPGGLGAAHGRAPRPEPARRPQEGLHARLEGRRPAPGQPDRGRRPGRGRRRLVLQGRVQGPGGVRRPQEAPRIPVPQGGIMTNLTFEKALAELEQIVAKLEKGGISLNESLALFEKGVKMSRFLRGELDKAERKVEILLKDEKGNLKAEDFEAEDGETEEGGGGA